MKCKIPPNSLIATRHFWFRESTKWVLFIYLFTVLFSEFYNNKDSKFRTDLISDKLLYVRSQILRNFLWRFYKMFVWQAKEIVRK